MFPMKKKIFGIQSCHIWYLQKAIPIGRLHALLSWLPGDALCKRVELSRNVLGALQKSGALKKTSRLKRGEPIVVLTKRWKGWYSPWDFHVIHLLYDLFGLVTPCTSETEKGVGTWPSLSSYLAVEWQNLGVLVLKRQLSLIWAKLHKILFLLQKSEWVPGPVVFSCFF